MTDQAEYNRIEALRRDAQHRYEVRLAEARARRAEDWAEHRAGIMRRWVKAKREAEERGEPFMLSDPPPLDPPEWWMAAVVVPDEPVHPPSPPSDPSTATAAPGVDTLGRPTTAAPQTPEEQFAAQESVAPLGSLRERVRRVLDA